MIALTSVIALSLVPSNFNVKDAFASVTDRLRINLQGRTHRFDDAAMVPTLDGHLTPQEYKKDLHLATTDTRAWCADRCLATGHCDVVEDLWEMSRAASLMSRSWPTTTELRSASGYCGWADLAHRGACSVASQESQACVRGLEHSPSFLITCTAFAV